MPENIILVVERMFDQSGAELVHAWTEPGQMAQWRGSPGWHVERETVTSELRLGGRHHHVKVRDDDPSVQVTTDALFTDSSTRTSSWRARRSVVIPGSTPEPAGASGRQDRSRRHPRAHHSGTL